jgi:hypothetical protein
LTEDAESSALPDLNGLEMLETAQAANSGRNSANVAQPTRGLQEAFRRFNLPRPQLAYRASCLICLRGQAPENF